MNFPCSSAMGKVLASELPRVSESTCKVLYPASAKASREIRESVFCLQLESSCYFLLLSLRPHVSHIYCVGFFMMLHIDFDPVNFLFSSWTLWLWALNWAYVIYGLDLTIYLFYSGTVYIICIYVFFFVMQKRGYQTEDFMWQDWIHIQP